MPILTRWSTRNADSAKADVAEHLILQCPQREIDEIWCRKFREDLRQYVTRFRSKDYKDSIKYTFKGNSRIAYAVDHNIFEIDLKKKILLRTY